MDRGRGRKKSIHGAQGPSCRVRFRQQFSPLHRHRLVDDQHPAFKSPGQFRLQPLSQPCAFSPAGQTIYSVAQLGQGRRAQKQSIFISSGQPLHHAGIWTRLHLLGYHVCIQQKVRRSISRGGSFRRFNSNPASRSGESAKNSARFPLRCVLRSHSSFPFDFQLSTVNLLALPTAVAPAVHSLVHCYPHGGSHLEQFRHPQPSGRTHSAVPKFSVSLTNHKTKASKSCSRD
jgi:hypothetical protein